MLARLVIIIALSLYLGVAFGSPTQNDIILWLETLDSAVTNRTQSTQNSTVDRIDGLSIESKLSLIATDSNTIPSESNAVVWRWTQPGREMMTHPLFAISIASLVLLALISARMLRRKQRNKKETSHSNTAIDTSHAILRDTSRFTGMTDYDITGKRTLIGRLPREITTNSCIIVIDHPTIGRNHATIKYQNNGYWVYDSGTVNGTYINGERLHDTIQLHNGDKVRFGRFEFDAQLPSAHGTTSH